MDFDFSGAIDLEDMNMFMTMLADTSEGSMDVDMYMITEDPEEESPSITTYMQVEMGGQSTGWISEQVPYTEWEAQDQFAQQLETFTFAEVKHAGEETVNGIDCYVLDITLDTDELIDFAMEQPGMEDALEGISISELLSGINDMTIKEWVAKDTNLPVKEQMSFSFSIDGVTVDMDMTMRIYDYNESLDVTPPAGVNAQPIEV